MSTRKEREKSRHRELILDAAEAVFAEKDYHSATVQEIAERAEFSVGYLYTLFKGKEQVFSELVEMRAAEYIAEVEESLRLQDDPVEQVRTVIRAKLAFFERRGRFFLTFSRLAAAGRSAGPVYLPEGVRERYRGFLERLAAVIQEGMRRGVFAPIDPATVVLCIEGATNQVIAHWVHSGVQGAADGTLEAVESVIFSGILARESAR
jgi:TetR/AcrR family transcriptional regulator